MSNTVNILRGPSGSGKSTLIQKEFPKAAVVSADQFFEQDGEYNFDPSKLGEAHAYCLGRFLWNLAKRKKEIVVDNTGIHTWEYENYIKLALMAKFEVRIISLVPKAEDIPKLASRNVHKVPEEIVQQMVEGFETVPDHLRRHRDITVEDREIA